MGAAALILKAARVAAAGVFVYAGAMKLLDPQQFALDIQHYELTPWSVSVLAAVYLPWLELFAGLALFIPRLALGAAATLSGLMLIFIGALTSAWARGLDVACGCFGKRTEAVQTNYPLLLGRDALILSVLIGLFWWEWRRLNAPRPGQTP